MVTSVTALIRKKPVPAMTAPKTAILRGPNLSIAQPMMGPSRPPSSRESEMTAAPAAALQPNSSRRTLKKMGKP